VKRLDGVFHAIADETRRRILVLLRDGERSVVELASHFPVTRPAISQHLRVLKDARLVRVRREGRTHYYRVETAPLNGVVDWLAYFDAFWDDKLGALARHLEKKE
jgi:DNA-binding transcriptional ArsR family regulator